MLAVSGVSSGFYEGRMVGSSAGQMPMNVGWFFVGGLEEWGAKWWEMLGDGMLDLICRREIVYLNGLHMA